jgi:hypothetical protein
MQRRDLLKLAAGSALGLGLSRGGLGPARRASAQAISPDEKFLFVVAAGGGGGMLDAFAPMLPGELQVADPSLYYTYTESQVAKPNGSNLRCVKRMTNAGGSFKSDYSLETLLAKNANDMALVAVDNTSVNHLVAQTRAITGHNVNGGGITIQEAVAMRIGQNKLLPNLNMTAGGYITPGDDSSVPAWARAELVNSPALFPLSTDPVRGLLGTPARAEVDRARAVRTKLDQASPFASAHAASALRRRYVELRDTLSTNLMNANLISKLMVIPDASTGLPGGLRLHERDLESSPDGQKIWSAFPNVMTDAMHAQGALAFLAAKMGVSSVVTLSPGATVYLPDGMVLGTPIGFDYSHVDHVIGQNVMWSRLGALVDGLITLLKSEPLGSGSMWDRSFIYVATEFGRSKRKEGGTTPISSSRPWSRETACSAASTPPT